MVSGCVRDPAIRSEERHFDHFGKSHVGGVIGGQIVAQLPYTRQERFVIESPDPEEPELSEGTYGVVATLSIVATQTLHHLEVYEVRGDEVDRCERCPHCLCSFVTVHERRHQN